jgi:hypothetical protein
MEQSNSSRQEIGDYSVSQSRHLEVDWANSESFQVWLRLAREPHGEENRYSPHN